MQQEAKTPGKTYASIFRLYFGPLNSLYRGYKLFFLIFFWQPMKSDHWTVQGHFEQHPTQTATRVFSKPILQGM